jgi:glycosyltransferase A (GT-A) superfamily protein (DUF2064 family)
MARTLSDGLARAERVCILGTDAPLVAPGTVRAAFDALARAEVVIGPATDGGYWLIGARCAVPELFTDVAWGTPRVLPETLRRVRGRAVELLPFHYDLDEAADLELLEAHLGVLPPSVAPATRRALGPCGVRAGAARR